MATRRNSPYVWITWLIKLLAGEEHCYWQTWFKAHHQDYEKVDRDFDRAQWNADHAAMVHDRARSLRATGYVVTVEGENAFSIAGTNGAKLGGKPDIVAIRDEELLIVDCKSGKPYGYHRMQMLLYLFLWPYARPEHEHLTIRGEIDYPSRGSVHVSRGEADDAFRLQFQTVIRTVTAVEEAPRAPSFNECNRCDLACSACPAKVTTGIEPVLVTLF